MKHYEQHERLAICERAIAHYGIKHQDIKALEESAELSAALGDFSAVLARRINGDYRNIAEEWMLLSHLTEEAADVQIMLWQLIAAHNLDIDTMIDKKLARLERNMDNDRTEEV